MLGKSAISDIKQGYVTLPLFYALQNDEDGELHKRVFDSALTEMDLTYIV